MIALDVVQILISKNECGYESKIDAVEIKGSFKLSNNSLISSLDDSS